MEGVHVPAVQDVQDPAKWQSKLRAHAVPHVAAMHVPFPEQAPHLPPQPVASLHWAPHVALSQMPWRHAPHDDALQSWS